MSDNKNQSEGPGTTGHVWDGIEELNNPLPRWWLWCFYGTIVWGLIYIVLYPAIPLVNGATPGVLGYSTRADVADDIASVREANASLDEALIASDLTTLASTNDEVHRYAVSGGGAVFRTFCAQCHGAGAAGAVGFPNLLDDDWLWGGDMAAIEQTIRYGVRAEEADDTRYSEMPAFGEILEKDEIQATAEYVLSLSGLNTDPAMATAGQELFAENCAACHGDEGKGDIDLGAPNLTDAIWLFGSSRDALITSITNARYGIMPAWEPRLTEAQIKQVTAYVHQLGGGL